MNAVVPFVVKSSHAGLVVDLVADFSDPWSFLGKRRLDRALGALASAGRPDIRWHGFRMVPEAGARRVVWRDQLQTRLPKGVSADFAERSLAEAGRELGIEFDFSKIATMPDTADAHRLVKLAAGEGLAMEMVEAIFRAFFQEGRDIGSAEELGRIGLAVGLSAALLETFSQSKAGREDVDQEESRLRSFGVVAVPNLLLNGRILVPGPADVPTYVQAIDQAIFPQVPEDAPKPTFH
jgi:predicted DsbA family dithiol-disulfide isomerase